MTKDQRPVTAASQLKPEKRMRLAATAAASNKQLHESGTGRDKGTMEQLNIHYVEKIISEWPELSRKAAEQTIGFYGPPNEATNSRLFWFYNGPWKRTVVYRDQIPHDFPEPHVDMLESVIDYHVPPEKMSEIAAFDGSIIVERTKGEVAARCDLEAANILALNLMHDIVTDKKTAKQARKFCANEMAAYALNRPAPYAEQFQFELPAGEQFDTDITTIKKNALVQTVKKLIK
ncbi:hypothetical protein [Planococcus salinus]|uniref:Uncharacterized protein n=1 Tax=Planococcus salinus TaxID=1848460 RepID=A0A3M8PBP9_9BACL|nr:hypothetical protein [Planococcus salinus]RNF41137.1 hypothetical protein EEX84_01960 [Planococcus salinus]